MNKKFCVAAERVTTKFWGRFSWRRRLTYLGLAGLALIAISIVPSNTQELPVRGASNLESWTSLYTRLPLSFEANRGQTSSRVKYLARGQGYTLFLTTREAVLALHRRKGSANGVVLRLRFLGARSSARATGENLLAGSSNYFLGNNPQHWQTDIPNYRSVLYHEIYPGIDLTYYGRQDQLENDFILSPGADPKSIRIGLKGVEAMHVDADGDLVLKVKGGRIYLRQPKAYQGNGTRRKTVAVHYVLRAGNQVGFRLGNYDHRQELVIDPVLTYSTYLGGNGGDVGYGIAVDSSGDVYITGVTNSSNFPTTAGAKNTGYSGGGDIFVTKLNPAGTASTSSSTPQLVYSTYLGGSGTDTGAAIAVNAGGDAFITGSTTSSDFPVTSGAFQTTYGGSGDAFVAQLSSTGASLVYSSYLGGSGADAGYALALDSSNDAFITGTTQSPDLKTTLNSLQPNNAGSSDAFVAEVSFSGSQLLYLSYLGGAQADVGQSIQVDSSGNVYVAGYTFSTNFPIQNPLQGANDGTVNAFVSEIAITSTSSSLKFSTYLGGSGDDRAYGLALDKSGDIYITGSGQSTNFPTSVGAFQLTNHGQTDAFVAKINPSGPTLVYSTLLGGSGTDQGNGIAVDSSGDAFVTGFTNSSDFPTQSPIQAILGITGGSTCGSATCSDAFVTEVNPTGTSLIQSTYLGGSGADYGQAIALGPSSNPFITGSTSSNNFPAIAGTYPAYQSSLTGVAGNAFVAEIAPTNAPGIAIVPGTINFGNVTQTVRSSVQTATVINEGTEPLTISGITFTETDNTGYTSDFAETDNCVGTVPASGGTCSIDITFTPSSTSAESGQFSIADNAAGSPQVINVSGSGITAATAVTVTPSSLSFGNVTVGKVSAAQTVSITNTGTQTLNITNVSTSGDFSQSNTCSSLNVLNVGQSCSVSVTFSPTASGARSGSLSIYDNATGSPQAVPLSGTGEAVFSLSSTTPNINLLVGSGTATAKVSASAPNNFTGSITLSCPSTLAANGGECSFNPANVVPGQTSTLTITNLTDSLPINTVSSQYNDAYQFQVTGTSGSQTATTNLNLLFQDYSVSSSPSLNTVVAGAPASYTLTLTPVNGFNSQVELACGGGMPPGATCSFSHSSVAPNGSPENVTLTIQTTKNASSLPPPPPSGVLPPLIFCLVIILLAGSAVFVRSRKLFPNLAGQRWLRVQVGMLCLLILCEVFLGSCRTNPSTVGTTTGNYSVTINGTLAANSNVVRSTIINLAVTCPTGQTCSQ